MRSSRACKNHFKIKLQGGAGQHQLEHLAAARIGRAGCDYNLPAAFVPAAAGRGNAATAALKRWRLGFAKANCLDRKSTRLNSSHVAISYAVFCLKKNIYK